MYSSGVDGFRRPLTADALGRSSDDLPMVRDAGRAA